jgi:hypothetical protein
MDNQSGWLCFALNVRYDNHAVFERLAC